ncbi:hypothetical protein GGD54_006334 [Rhizobium tropici]|uniref:Uncharacterized protein n=2 Tax=Rhizobium TaxID=379 RepID=A0ABR6R9L3_RHITR|nr:hypothetical protein [Rhizobium tropici]MBB5596822.1 hypothetical protein [Rhizobium tropici]MBB6489568.1 hypothetical protein [Rhizobium lusitanum]MBB6495872.1 hypothetical protein [Rhizobium tropici]
MYTVCGNSDPMRFTKLREFGANDTFRDKCS